MEALTVPIPVRTIRLYVIEPQILLRKALCNFAETDGSIRIAGESNTFDERSLVDADPDIVVIDCDAYLQSMPDAVARCRRGVSAARICVLSAHLVPDVMTRALKAGADGYIVKDISPEQFADCISRIHSEGFYVDERLSLHVLRASVQGEITSLSPRELDVLRLVAQGMSNQEIGDTLALSHHTVKNHVANILSKLHLTTRTQLAIYAIRCGWS